uniref:uncharacterized protein LOC122580613 isoform X2 n=1 Tax=Erigeron canadensis TaxID=72917 RepID=UPI001CB9A3A1|nr:uncharacterized protein LOC122580613 isoform X2 [Erigeron canadensis]
MCNSNQGTGIFDDSTSNQQEEELMWEEVAPLVAMMRGVDNRQGLEQTARVFWDCYERFQAMWEELLQREARTDVGPYNPPKDAMGRDYNQGVEGFVWVFWYCYERYQPMWEGLLQRAARTEVQAPYNRPQDAMGRGDNQGTENGHEMTAGINQG